MLRQSAGRFQVIPLDFDNENTDLNSTPSQLLLLRSCASFSNVSIKVVPDVLNLRFCPKSSTGRLPYNAFHEICETVEGLAPALVHAGEIGCAQWRCAYDNGV